MPETPLVQVQHVTFGYGQEVVLDHVDLEIGPRDFLAVIGPNGGGKTTLLKVMLGLLQPRSGSVLRFPTRASALGYVPQFATFDRDFPLRVREVVTMGRLGLRRPMRRYTAADHDQVDAEFRDKLVDTLRELHATMPIVVVTHDLTPFAGVVRQIACMNRRLHYHPEGRLTPEMLEEVYGCPVELITHGVPHRVLGHHAHE